MRWLDLRLSELRSFARMLPRLHAEEALLAIPIVAYGSGVMTPEDQRSFRSDLEERAQIRRRRREMPAAEIAAVAAALGVAVVREPKVEA